MASTAADMVSTNATERWSSACDRCHTLVEHVGEALDRHPLLRERVAVAQGHRAVLERLVVDRDRERRADLVLAPVALADVAAVVVLDGHPLAQLLVDRARLLGVAVLAQQRQHG